MNCGSAWCSASRRGRSVLEPGQGDQGLARCGSGGAVPSPGRLQGGEALHALLHLWVGRQQFKHAAEEAGVHRVHPYGPQAVHGAGCVSFRWTRAVLPLHTRGGRPRSVDRHPAPALLRNPCHCSLATSPHISLQRPRKAPSAPRSPLAATTARPSTAPFTCARVR